VKRWHEETALMTSRRRAALTEHDRQLELGRLRKRKPLDCGNPRCGVCHPSKRWYRKDRRHVDRREIDAQLA
jgi:hypothetical protein